MDPIEGKAKKHSTSAVIILCLFTALVVYFVTTIPSKHDEPNAAAALYAEELKDIGTKFQKCLERAKVGLDSTVEDPLEGTIISRESIAETERDTCNRQYESQMRILKNRYE